VTFYIYERQLEMNQLFWCRKSGGEKPKLLATIDGVSQHATFVIIQARSKKPFVMNQPTNQKFPSSETLLGRTRLRHASPDHKAQKATAKDQVPLSLFVSLTLTEPRF